MEASKEAAARWAPRWAILCLVLVDAPLLHFLTTQPSGSSPDEKAAACLTARELGFLRAGLVVHLLIPIAFLAKWTLRWVLGLRRRDQTPRPVLPERSSVDSFMDLSVPPEPPVPSPGPLLKRIVMNSVVPENATTPKWNYGLKETWKSGSFDGAPATKQRATHAYEVTEEPEARRAACPATAIPTTDSSRLQIEAELVLLEAEVKRLRRKLKK